MQSSAADFDAADVGGDVDCDDDGDVVDGDVVDGDAAVAVAANADAKDYS